MAIYRPKEIFASSEFKILLEQLYKPVAWGYVTRRTQMDTPKELLVVERIKPDDILRKGELVLPGGGLKGNETYEQTAMREVEEEAGVFAMPTGKSRFSNLSEYIILKPREKIIGIVEPAGNMWVYYKDSGKSYHGKMIDLLPRTKPKLEKITDAKNPKYIAIRDAFKQKNNFTPACQILLEIIESAEFKKDLFKEDDLLLENEDIKTYIKPT